MWNFNTGWKRLCISTDHLQLDNWKCILLPGVYLILTVHTYIRIVKLLKRVIRNQYCLFQHAFSQHTGMPVTFLSHFHLWPKGTQAYLQGKHFSKTSLCLTVWSSGMYWQKSCRDAEPSEWSIVSASLSASVNNLQCYFLLLMQSVLTFTCTARVSLTDPPSKLLLFQLCWTY